MVVTNSTGHAELEPAEWGEEWPMPAVLAPMSAWNLNAHYRKWEAAGEDATAYPVCGGAEARADAARCRVALHRVLAGGRV